MTYRFLGRSGLQVSAISLGGWLTYGGYTEQGKLGFTIHRCCFGGELYVLSTREVDREKGTVCVKNWDIERYSS